MLSPVVSTPLTFMLILQHLANLCQKLKTPRLSLNISFLYLLIVPLSIFFKKLSIPTALWLGRCFWNPSLARFALILEFTIFKIEKNRILPWARGYPDKAKLASTGRIASVCSGRGSGPAVPLFAKKYILASPPKTLSPSMTLFRMEISNNIVIEIMFSHRWPSCWKMLNFCCRSCFLFFHHCELQCPRVWLWSITDIAAQGTRHKDKKGKKANIRSKLGLHDFLAFFNQFVGRETNRDFWWNQILRIWR